MEDAELTREVKALAHRVGFARVGAARAGALEPEGEQLQAWLDAGRHGEMGWMAETASVRKDPRHPGMVPGAESVLVMAAPYGGGPAKVQALPGRVADYARGRDYHRVLSKRTREIVRLLSESGHDARSAVDSKPVLERAWAERAGVGFVGKNCCLIVPGLGSHVFLSCVITTAPLVPDPPMPRRCGDCRLCLDACPTRAFEGPRELDARRCISYLTIEHEGPIPEALRASMNDWLFGCDVCQDVCPYNRSGAGLVDEAFLPRAQWDGMSAADFLTMSADSFADWAAGSPTKRAGYEGLARNASIVLGNRGERRHLPILREAADSHRSQTVRESAHWAIRQIEQRTASR